MLVLGLTGSLAMGKSTVAAMFGEAGVAVFDADRAVHALYDGAAVPLIEAAFPGTTENGAVDRAALAERVVGDDKALAKLEAIVHPLVHEAEKDFRVRAAAAGHRIVLLDIPLLFETGGEDRVDATVVVTAREEIQRQRLREREESVGADRAAALLARQMSDAEKRARAHFIIDTSGDFSVTRAQVADVLRAVAGIAAGR